LAAERRIAKELRVYTGLLWGDGKLRRLVVIWDGNILLLSSLMIFCKNGGRSVIVLMELSQTGSRDLTSCLQPERRIFPEGWNVNCHQKFFVFCVN
jgi:hypothetical protein